MSYETKFANLIKMCAEAKQAGVDVVLVPSPETLGDNYAEIVESLNRITDAELKVAIVPRSQRTAPPRNGANVVPIGSRHSRRQRGVRGR